MALSGFLQNAVNKSVSISKDINKNVQKGILQVETINEIDLCNLISFFLTKAFPTGSDVDKAFQDLKKTATDVLQKIEDSEKSIIDKPFLKGSIQNSAGINVTGSATGSGGTNNSNGSTPSQANTISGSNAFYGGGGAFTTPPLSSSVSTTSNAGTSAGQGLSLDQSLEKLRAVKAIVQSINIPPFLLKIIPGGQNISDSLKRLSSVIPDNVSNIPNDDIKKIFDTYAQIKQILTGISQAENPADLLKVFAANNAISKLQDILNPAQLLPLINSIVKSVETVSKILNTLVNYISKLASVINTLNTIVKILSKLAITIRNLALPARWATVGIILKLQKLADTLEKKTAVAASNLDQTSQYLNQFSKSLTSVQRRINYLLELLRVLLDKLTKCEKTKNLPVTNKLKDVIISLDKTNSLLNTLLPAKPKKNQVTYKGFVIEIVEEEVTDQGITLTRRYGVALDKRGVVVLQSDLTFANNTDLIFNEVRFLIDKNKVGINTPEANAEDAQISAELDLPTEQEQLVDEAAMQADIDKLVNEIQPEKNLVEKSKKDKRRIKRLKRIIKGYKRQGLNKQQIKNKVLRRKRFTEQEFEDAFNNS